MMESIQLSTYINAPAKTCFDLARSIDLHVQSMQKSHEQAIAGRTSGLLNPNETVTWNARHFGIAFMMQVSITQMDAHRSFTDEMNKGPFKRLRHQHKFEPLEQGTMMIDDFEFESPFGPIGKLVDRLVLKTYLTQLLSKRNNIIKQQAEIKSLHYEKSH